MATYMARRIWGFEIGAVSVPQSDHMSPYKVEKLPCLTQRET